MRKILLSAFCLVSVLVNAQVYTKEFTDQKLVEKAEKWIKKAKWAGKFSQALPHESVNATEFYLQYKKNPKQWRATFKWLAEHDLQNIPKGSYTIEGTDIVVKIEDSKNSELSKRRSESHRHTIDFQYVVKGVERFGIIDHETSQPNTKYKPDVIHYDYDRTKALFYDSTPDRFFIFFPDDWHIAKVKTDQEDQNIRVIVVKLKYM